MGAPAADPREVVDGPSTSSSSHAVNDDDNYDSGTEDDPVPSGAPVNLKEKRRLQKSIFDAFLSSPACQESFKSKTKNGSTREADDDEQTVHALVAQSQGTQIVKNPREYQIELFERAKHENTIAVLDTGSGKTLIAVLLLRWIIDNELEARAAGKPPRISFFLVASVNLVYQQYHVLDINLDHNIAHLSGADNKSSNSKLEWQKLFSENKVIVCTAEILFQNLSRGYINMKQINLLVFDEAHHTKKNHSFARIVKDFYIVETDHATRPRIFGMTASPIDAKADVRNAASELEHLLNSRIATTSNMSLAEAIKKPVENIVRYPALPLVGFETAFLRKLKARFGEIEVFATIFLRATEIARHLGRWCADCHLVLALSPDKLKKLESTVEKEFYKNTVLQDPERRQKELDNLLKELNDAITFAQEHGSLAIADVLNPEDRSTKVNSLVSYLKSQFERETSHRCIVFVKEKLTARLLHALFERNIGTKFMKSEFLVGQTGTASFEDNFSIRQQVVTLLRFRKGTTNCLFATSVAEEGLDVPDCNLVIRFDLYSTMIQYVQSRGRARKTNSTFIHMIEKGNTLHENMLSEVRWHEQAMRQYCDSIPEDQKLQGNQDALEMLMEKEKNIRSYTEPSTGAKLTYGNAMSILATFVTAIPTDSDEPMHPTCVVVGTGQKFTAEVIIPGHAPPIRSITGRAESKKRLAKCSAAFDACIQLRKKQYLDGHFNPTYQKKLPAMRNALLAAGMNRTTGYDMQIKPKIWAEQRGTLPSELWITLLDFPQGLERPHQSFAFLTRTSIPQLPSFPVFQEDGRTTPVLSASLSKPLKLTSELLKKFTTFTLTVFRDVFTKTYEEDADKLSYWLAPAAISIDADAGNATLDPQHAIDWDSLETVVTKGETQWTPDLPDAFLINKFITDPWTHRKFYSRSIDYTRQMSDDVPADVARPKTTWKGSIIDYSCMAWRKTKLRKVFTEGQPVIEAETVLLRRNMLAAPEKKEVSVSTKAYICLEPLRISALTPAIAAAFFYWPAIIHRLESYLIAIEGVTSVGVDCAPNYVLAAFTKDSDNQGEHDSEDRVNFQRGMGDNYERLEFIGDTFLKTATTISTFIMNPNENEFEFHVRRMLMLCNENLYKHAVEFKLYEYIRSMAFSRRTWYPEGMKLLKGTGVVFGEEKVMFHEDRKHVLGQKTIADVCEALIGAAFLTHDRPDEPWQQEHWQPAIEAVTKFVVSKDHIMLKMEDYRKTYEKPTYQIAQVTAVQHDLARKVSLEHDYSFKYPRLLFSAFSHPSNPYMQYQVPSYQRLEFLGDALLDQASIAYLFYKYPNADPQWLTEHKMAMVSNKFLGALCVSIGFYKHLRHQHSQLGKQIQTYVEDLLEAKATSNGSRDYWTTIDDPPKCLPDIMEAYVGALFIDSDFDYGQVQRFFQKHVQWFFEDMSIYDTFANNHPCTHLHRRLQTGFGCMDYRLMAKELPGVDGLEHRDVVAVVMIHDRIVASAGGKGGRYARLRVANRALEALDGLAPFEFRTKFLCDCRMAEADGDGKDSKEEMSTGGMGADCTIDV